MKTIFLSLAIAIVSIVSAGAQTKTESVKVYGNCGMCKKSIEAAASKVKGVSKADWNKETKMMTLTLDTTKTSVKNVEVAVAKVGYDTDKVRAKDEVYASLPGCCQYERPKAIKKEEQPTSGALKSFY